jgi:hypothetical protein
LGDFEVPFEMNGFYNCIFYELAIEKIQIGKITRFHMEGGREGCNWVGVNRYLTNYGQIKV